jgi:hypothetical protein
MMLSFPRSLDSSVPSLFVRTNRRIRVALMSPIGIGTKRTYRDVYYLSYFGGKADNICAI